MLAFIALLGIVYYNMLVNGIIRYCLAQRKKLADFWHICKSERWKSHKH